MTSPPRGTARHRRGLTLGAVSERAPLTSAWSPKSMSSGPARDRFNKRGCSRTQLHDSRTEDVYMFLAVRSCIIAHKRKRERFSCEKSVKIFLPKYHRFYNSPQRNRTAVIYLTIRLRSHTTRVSSVFPSSRGYVTAEHVL